MASTDRDQVAWGEPGPELAVVCGVPGVGKSTVAGWIADHLDAVHLRTDEIRKELFPDPDYTERETQTVYETLVDGGRAALARGESAVLDATFKRSTHRTDALRMARDIGVPWRVVKVEADPAVVRDRIRRRTDDPSDADVGIYEQFRKEFDPIEAPHATVDNSGSLAETVGQLEAEFARDRVPVRQ